MDVDKDDKSIVQKTVDAVKGFAATVSEAAHKAMEPEPINPGDEVVMMPMAATGFPGDTAVPPFVVVRKQKKSPRKSRAKAAKKTAKRSAKTKKKTAKAAATKAKSSTGRKTVGKKAKKHSKKEKARR